MACASPAASSKTASAPSSSSSASPSPSSTSTARTFLLSARPHLIKPQLIPKRIQQVHAHRPMPGVLQPRLKILVFPPLELGVQRRQPLHAQIHASPRHT